MICIVFEISFVDSPRLHLFGEKYNKNSDILKIEYEF